MGASNSNDDGGAGDVRRVRVLVVEDEKDDFTLLVVSA